MQKKNFIVNFSTQGSEMVGLQVCRWRASKRTPALDSINFDDKCRWQRIEKGFLDKYNTGLDFFRNNRIS